MNTDPIPLANLSAGDLLTCLDHPHRHIDRVDVHLVNDRTLLIVGFDETARDATGRVAWVDRLDDGWSVDRGHANSVGRRIHRLESPRRAREILRTLADLRAVIAWAKGAA